MKDECMTGPMINPPHPGEVLKGLYLEPLELTITAAAKGLGVTRKTLSQLIHGHHAVTPEMAIRLSEAFGTTPQLWLNMQQNFDLRQAEKKSRVTVQHFWPTQNATLQPA